MSGGFTLSIADIRAVNDEIKYLTRNITPSLSTTSKGGDILCHIVVTCMDVVVFVPVQIQQLPQNHIGPIFT